MAYLLLMMMLLVPVEDGVHLITEPRRTFEEIEQIYAQMPPVEFTAADDRWKHLPRTHDRLQRGDTLKIVMLGDSIINDTARSGWIHLLRNNHPDSHIEVSVVVRGSTGCWYYHEEDRVQRYVLSQDPDLVIIGGISQRRNYQAIENVITQVRDHSDAEILLMTGVFGRNVDPNSKQWSEQVDMSNSRDERAGLTRLAEKLDVAFLDIHRHWGRYIRDSGRDVDSFKRDPVHANPQGEQIVGRILAAWLTATPAQSTQ